MGVNATLFYLGITCARVGCLQRGLLCSDVPDVRRSALGSACKEKAFLEGCWMRALQGISRAKTLHLHPAASSDAACNTLSAPLKDASRSRPTRMPKGGPGEIWRRRRHGQQGTPESHRRKAVGVGIAAENHGTDEHGQRKRVAWTLHQLIEMQYGHLERGGGIGVKNDCERPGSDCCSFRRELAPSVNAGELGQRTLAAGALGSATANRLRHDTVIAAKGVMYGEGPRYTWLREEERKLSETSAAWSKSETPASPSSVMDFDIGLQDEPAEVVIIGGGPHALAALAALNEDSILKGDTVCVIDPGSHFMQSWNARFDALEINHLRSPALAHPVAFDPTALVDFAIDEGRTSELIDAPVPGPWLASTDIDREKWLKALPSTALFRDFCLSLEAKLPHRWASGTAVCVSKDSSNGKFQVRYRATADEREHVVAARAVILATGPVGKWNIPAPFEPHLASRLVLHTEELLGESKGTTLSEEITRRYPSASRSRVLVIGGGISAAQAALAASRAGHQVVLRSRQPLKTYPFDIDYGWLDMRKADRLRFEFLCLPLNKRRDAVREAQSGGSVPANYMEELQRLSQASPDMLRIEVDDAIDRSHVRIDDDGEHVVINGETFAMVILATGVVTAPSVGDSSPLYHSIKELLKAPTVNGLPQVDSRLRWVPHENVFVLGANALLELGPGGGNLMGAMRGARIVANELYSLVNEGASRSTAIRIPMPTDEQGRKVRPERQCFKNQYVSLGDRVRFGDGCDSEIVFLAEQLQLRPQAEVALRRAHGAATAGLRGKKQIKATPYLKGAPLMGTLRGNRDPMGDLTTRTHWATYW